jgi:polysaccharide biosynthesis transport protein
MKQELPDASVAEALKSEIIIKLRGQYLDFAAREAIYSQRYGPDHLAVTNLRSQMREILRSIKDEMQKIEESTKSDYEIAQTREQSLRESLNQAVSRSQITDQARIQLEELESAAQTAETLYDNFLERQMQALQRQSFPIPEARLIDAAEPPLSKNHPKTFLVLLLTAATGLAMSFGAASLRELSDLVFRSSEQVEEMLLVKCLALLPNLQATASPRAATRRRRTTTSTAFPAMIRRLPLLSHVFAEPFSQIGKAMRSVKEFLLVKCLEVPPNLRATVSSSAAARQDRRCGSASPGVTRSPLLLSHVLDEPFSQFTEALRSVKVASDLNHESIKVFGLTSTLPHEGKSTVAANYAQLIAQGERSTVLIDADLRNPNLSRQYPFEGPGLVEVIAGRRKLHDVVKVDRRTGLKVLPSGQKSNLINTNELLSSAAMLKVIDGLRESFDYIIVDLPPLIPIVDARAAVNFIDAYIFVVEWGRTRIDTVKHSLSNASEIYERMLGVVLNKVDMTKLGRYEPHLGDYYGTYSTQYTIHSVHFNEPQPRRGCEFHGECCLACAERGLLWVPPHYRLGINQ